MIKIALSPTANLANSMTETLVKNVMPQLTNSSELNARPIAKFPTVKLVSEDKSTIVMNACQDMMPSSLMDKLNATSIVPFPTVPPAKMETIKLATNVPKDSKNKKMELADLNAMMLNAHCAMKEIQTTAKPVHQTGKSYHLAQNVHQCVMF